MLAMHEVRRSLEDPEGNTLMPNENCPVCKAAFIVPDPNAGPAVTVAPGFQTQTITVSSSNLPVCICTEDCGHGLCWKKPYSQTIAWEGIVR